MAAYGTLASLQNLVEHIQLYHAHHPTFLYEHQMQLESLHKRIVNLQDLLEWCSNNGRTEAQDLESLIMHAANSAEDIVELYIVGDIRARSSEEHIMANPQCFINVHKVDPVIFSEQLQKVIEDMDLMEKEMMKIKEKSKAEDQQLTYMLPSASLEYSPGVYNDDMVGFKDELNEIMNKLNDHDSNLKIISITGMGGSGKSILARSVHDNKSVMNNFDVRGWIIISQEFRARERLSNLLMEFKVPHSEIDEYHVLGEKLHKHLYGRRFLIIVDDIWSVKDWEKLQLFLPDNSNGSRIILTTRLLNVATDAGSSHICEVNFMDEDTSWRLLCKKAFLDQTCPPRLEVVGKRISKNCKGLPLSLVVVGGLLAKLEKTRECWEKIAGEINMIVTSEDEERCLKILYLSYSHLPIYLKPCFLYMGIFAEDESIAIDSLIDLWIAEGFVKSRGSSKSLEEVARNYLEDLIQRSLIYVSKIGNCGTSRGYEEYLLEGSFTFASLGKMELIRIHDLLRDLAVNEAHKEKFLHVTLFRDPNFSMSMNSERRVGFHSASDSDFQRASVFRGMSFLVSSALGTTFSVSDLLNKFSFDKQSIRSIGDPERSLSEFDNVLSTATFLRSLICDTYVCITALPGFSLLRVSSKLNIKYSPEAIFQVINSRNLQICQFERLNLSSIQLLWNLQVLVVTRSAGMNLVSDSPNLDKPATFQIWEMPLLRKLFMHNFILPDPPQAGMDGKSDLVTNLQVISYILDLKCTEEVLRKISNIHTLHLMYNDVHGSGVSQYCLGNLDCLHKLQKVGFWFGGDMDWPDQTDLLQNIGLSKSIQILSLGQCGLEWELLTEKVGSLPNLEELSLYDCYTGEEWNSEEGYFLTLKILRMRTCRDLVRWSTESSHFPCLEHLFLEKTERLEEIPLDIGEIATLQSIDLKMCSSSIIASARIILQEQQRCGNDWLRVLVNEEGLEEKLEEVGGEEDQEEEKKKKIKRRGFVAFVISFLAILGSSYAWHHKNSGAQGKGADDKDKQKKDNDRRRRRRRKDPEDLWWLFYDYP